MTKNYKITVKQQDVTFTLTNTYRKPNSQSTATPTVSTLFDTPTPNSALIPNEPTPNDASTPNGATPNTTDTPSDKLPQMGFLWWHVLILIAIGVVLCLIVGIVYKGRKHDK